MLNSKLINALRTKSDGDSLYYKLMDIREKIKPFLAKIIESFPEYTNHDIEHSDNVLKNLGWLIPKPLLDAMNVYELFFVSVACYLHDIGMVRTSIDDLKGVSTEEIREYHHDRSEEFVLSNYSQIGIDDVHQARIIGRLCKGHRGNLDNKEIFSYKEPYLSGNFSINVQLLSSFLQIADDLDLSHGRTPRYVYDLFKPNNIISKREWEKHLSIQGISLDPENSNRIIIRSYCTKPEIHRIVKNIELKIQNKLDKYSEYLHQYSKYVNYIPHRVIVSIEQKGYEAIDLKFQLDEEEITSLLLGEKLYDRKEASIRELLQNSIDAINMRREKDTNIIPKIIFNLNTSENKLIVSDNGIGMSKYIIEKYLVKIGSSFYRSEDFNKNAHSFSPISHFGIGILSCFMIAEQINIQTNYIGTEKWDIDIFNVEEYFFIRPGTRARIGTEITLKLKKEIVEKLDIKKEILYYTRHLDIPIIILIDDVEEIIKQEDKIPKLDYFLKTNKDQLTKKEYDRYQFISYKCNTKDYDLILGILYMKEDSIKPPRTYFYSRKLYEIMDFNNKIYVSNKGIYVNKIDDFIPPYYDKGLYVDVNLKSDKLELNASRTNIIKNDNYVNLMNDIEMHILNLYGELLNLISNKTLFNAVFNYYFKFSIRYDLFEETPIKEYSKHFISLLEENYFKNVIINNNVYITSLKEIKNYKNIKHCIYGLPYNITYRNYVIKNSKIFESNVMYIIYNYYKEDDIYKILNMNYKKYNLKSFLEYTENTNLKLVIPKTWKIVSFKNYNTKLFIDILSEKTFINNNHNFIKLLSKYYKHYKSDKTIMELLGSFFIQFKKDVKNDINIIHEKQKIILKWFEEQNIINNLNYEDYLIRKNEIPKWW